MSNDLFYRSLELDRAGVSEDGRTVELAFSSETPVRRWFGQEFLLHNEGSVDLSRLRQVGSLIFGHNPSQLRNVLGPIKKVWLDADTRMGRAVVEFDTDADADLALQKVRSGSLRGVSFGYAIVDAVPLKEGERYEDKASGKTFKGPGLVATRWVPYEITLTPVPADAKVGVGRDLTRSLDGINLVQDNHQEEGMDKDEIRAMVKDAVAQVAAEVREALPGMVQAAMADAGKPVLRIDASELRDLTGMAGAISPDAKLRVYEMYEEGKTATEVRDALIQFRASGRPTDAQPPVGTPNSVASGIPGGQPGQVTPSGSVEYKRAEDVPEDTFLSMIRHPSILPLQ